MSDPLCIAAPRGSARFRFIYCRWLVAVGALAVGGCGGGDDNSNAAVPPMPPSAATQLSWDGVQATWDTVVWQ